MLQTLLAEGRPLLADGATGTNLFAMGLASGESPELWNANHPDRVRALHQAFVDAGSDIILTNSFGGNRRRLALHGAEGRARELNRLAAGNARAVADKAGRAIVVAGSVGPTGDIFAPLGPLTEEEAVEVFAEQIEGLREGGADVVWIETMSAAEEIRAARARGDSGRHALYRHRELRHRRADDDGRRAGGVRGARQRLRRRSRSATARIAASAPSDLLVSILAMSEADPDAVLIAKANAGVPHWHGAEIHYSGTPDLMQRFTPGLAVDCGARIVGGCCGNTPAHVAAIRRGLDAHRPGARPTVEAIVAALGPLVAPPAAEAAPAAAAASGHEAGHERQGQAPRLGRRRRTRQRGHPA